MKKIMKTVFGSIALVILVTFCSTKINALEDGSENSPFLIDSVEELIAISNGITSVSRLEGMHYRLESDLDLSGIANWSAIGGENGFSGVFDGNSHTITGLHIDVTDSSGNHGLFGYLYTNGVIKNLNLTNVSIASNGQFVGGIAGRMLTASIINCHVSGDISGHDRIGGITGSSNTSSIDRSSFEGNVRKSTPAAAGDNIAGIVGYMATTTISTTFATGSVEGRDNVGGLVGHLSSSATPSRIENCYYRGSVLGRNNIGGIIGDINSSNSNSENMTTNCYVTGSVSGANHVGGIAGYLYTGYLYNCVSLVRTITASSKTASIGRVVGTVKNGFLSGNMAFSGMKASGSTFNTGNNTNELSGGINISSEEILADGTLKNHFTTPIWTIENGKLPDFSNPETPDEYLSPLVITSDMFLPLASVTYNGNAYLPQIVSNDEDITYTVTYSDNIEAGTAIVEVNGHGNYTGTVVIEFTINKAEPNYVKPLNISATYGDILSSIILPSGWSFDDAGGTLVGNAGIHSFPVTFTPVDANNYNIIHEMLNVNVNKKEVSKPIANYALEYNSLPQNGLILNNSDAYTVENNIQTEAGSYTATVTLNSNYMWDDKTTEKLEIVFTIGSIAGTATVSITDFVYDGVFTGEINVGLTTGDYQKIDLEYSEVGLNFWNSEAPVDAGQYDVRAHLSGSASGDYIDLTTAPSTYEILKAMPIYELPTDLHARYTLKPGVTYLMMVILPFGFTWDNPLTELSSVGTFSYPVTYTNIWDMYNYEIAHDTINVEVLPGMVTMPVIKTGILFDNLTHIGVEYLDFSYMQEEYYTYSGTISAKEAGTYTATFTLNSGFVWYNGTSENLILNWTIGESLGEANISIEDTEYKNQINPTVSIITGDYSVTIFEYYIDSRWQQVAPEDVGTYSARAILSESSSSNYADITTPEVSFNIIPKTLTDELLEVTESYTFDGMMQRPIAKTDGLVENVDYSTTYANNINAGTATITITGMGSYQGSISKNFIINRKTILRLMFNDIENLLYTGSPLTPTVALNGSDPRVTYTTTYIDNVNAGLASAVVEGTENYIGTITINFVINKQKTIPTAPDNLVAVYGNVLTDVVLFDGWSWVNDTTDVGDVGIKDFEAIFTPSDLENYSIIYTSLEVYVKQKMVAIPSVITGLKYTGNTITGIFYDELSTAYDVLGDVTGTSIGKYQATFSLKNGNYIWNDQTSADITLDWMIGQNHGVANILMEDFIYDGISIGNPIINITLGNWENSKYQYSLDDVTFSDFAPVNAGSYYVRAYLYNSINNVFTDLITESVGYSITRKLLDSEVILEEDNFTYNGTFFEPNVSVTGLILNSDYTIEYSNNINAGTAMVTITGINNYSGILEKQFTIDTAIIEESMFRAIDDTIYTGAMQQPIPFKTSGDNITYSVSYENNTNAGIASVIINGTDNYSGEVRIQFTINKAIPSYTEPDSPTATYGDTLGDVALPNGWNWEDEATKNVGDAGNNQFFARYVPTDSNNYESVLKLISINVKKATIAKPTKVENIIFTGSLQVGIMYTDNNSAYSLISGDVSATEVGEYSATFRLDSNYTWEDGQVEDLVLTWSILENTEIRIQANYYIWIIIGAVIGMTAVWVYYFAVHRRRKND